MSQLPTDITVGHCLPGPITPVFTPLLPGNHVLPGNHELHKTFLGWYAARQVGELDYRIWAGRLAGLLMSVDDRGRGSAGVLDLGPAVCWPGLSLGSLRRGSGQRCPPGYLTWAKLWEAGRNSVRKDDPVLSLGCAAPDLLHVRLLSAYA